MNLVWLIPASVVLALIVIVFLVQWLRAQDTGNEKMQSIAAAIREGAFAFLARQYKTIGILAVVVAIILYIARFPDWHAAVAFIAGAFCSALSGYIGMATAVTANLRVAAGARKSMNTALTTAFRGGAVTGLAVTALSLGGVALLYYLYGGAAAPDKAPDLIVGFGFGASFVALFAQLGGGIYTKAADVGADLVGKVEAGIPEDDPRNPAVVADLVGDNVGDCAGRGADLFESTAAENIGAMILGIIFYQKFHTPSAILFPLVARAWGMVSSIVGIFTVRAREDEDPMAALNRGYLVTFVLATAGFYFVVTNMLSFPGVNTIWFFAAGAVGLVLSYLFVWVTQYYTEYRYRPVREIAQASVTGPATNIISGIAVGMESVGIPVLLIVVALWMAHQFGEWAMPGGGLYGTAVATMGMLATVTYILAMDTYGPITDNAGGIVEMSEAPKEIRDRTDKLDASGNTTKALTKGYAVGSAALAAFLLFSAYGDEVARITEKTLVVDLAQPHVFIGAMVGTALVFLFCSTAIRAVGKAAQYVIQDVRAQFRENPGIMQGTSKPNYARCVDIVTKGALKEMVLPGALVVLTPVVLGFVMKWVGGRPGTGAEAVAGFLQIGTVAGVIMALFLNTGGGAWDNAKKYIETGALGGKRSDPHKAAVVGDTVGDPFKDTAGPSLHVLVKLISTITLVLAALFV